MKAQGEIVTWDSGPEDTGGTPGLRKIEGILHITKSSSMILFLAIFYVRTLIQISYQNISHLMSNWQSVSFQWREENIATHAPRTQSRQRPTLEDRLSASQRARSNLNMSLSPDDTLLHCSPGPVLPEDPAARADHPAANTRPQLSVCAVVMW